MLLLRRATVVVLFLLLSASSPAPQITASNSGTKVRFTAPASACQIRVQVIANDGTPLFDSSWRDGDVFDWQPDASFPVGSYRCLVSVKDVDGVVTDREVPVVAQPDSVAITTLAHDETNGAIVSTTGDLTFRFGNFLAGKEVEKMRLTADGKLGIGTDKPQATLDVNGSIRASNGIVFADGTTLTTKDGQLVATPAATKDGPVAAPRPNLPILGLKTMPPKQTNPAPQAQFVVGDTGVTIGTSNPTYNLNVAGPINTATAYQLNGNPFLSGNSSSFNLVLGTNAGFSTSGGDNTFVGPNAGMASTTGSFDTFVGTGSGLSTNTGANDSFLGYGAGYSNQTGNNNAFFGASAGYSNVSGSDNAFFGYAAGTLMTASANTFIGRQSGASATSGVTNTFVGYYTGQSSTTESNNTLIGADADITAGINNATAIGYFARAAQSNTVVLGSINGVNGASITTSTGIATNTPNQYLGVGGGITVDENNTNNGTLLANGVISFGTGASNAVSGEGIGSQRTGTGNLYGLDFYTLYTKRMSIANGGGVTVYGNLNVTGNVSKGGGSFKIDDPIDPQNKTLSHSFVESPDMMDIYNGNVVLDANGEAVVQLPDWFEALNQDFRYQLTCMHGFAPVYIDEEIANNQFKIAGGKPGMKVSWQVTGIRHDPYANVHRIPVEEDKPAGERGTYLHPDAYAGQHQ